MTIEVLRKQYPDIIIQTNFSKRIRANIIDILRTRQIFEPKQLPDIFIAEPGTDFTAYLLKSKTRRFQGAKISIRVNMSTGAGKWRESLKDCVTGDFWQCTGSGTRTQSGSLKNIFAEITKGRIREKLKIFLQKL